MYIKRKFINRHKILGALQTRMNESYRPDILDSAEIELSWGELRDASGLTESEILEQIDFLLTSEEICNNEVNFSSSYLILQKGTTSFYDKKYLNIGKKEFKDDLYDILKLFSGFILLAIALITFARNIMITEKNSKEIENLKNEIKILKISIQKNQ